MLTTQNCPVLRSDALAVVFRTTRKRHQQGLVGLSFMRIIVSGVADAIIFIFEFVTVLQQHGASRHKS